MEIDKYQCSDKSTHLPHPWTFDSVKNIFVDVCDSYLSSPGLHFGSVREKNDLHFSFSQNMWFLYTQIRLETLAAYSRLQPDQFTSPSLDQV